MPAFPLLSTKLNLPPRRPGLVARARLLEKLDQSLQPGNRLTILSAPAGFGKTSLAADWLGALAQRGLPCAWLSLDEGDNDLTRFLHYFIAALQKIHPGLGEAALALLPPAVPQAPPVESLMLPLINEIGALPGDCVLVLDDYQVIGDLDIHQALGYLVEHQPAQLHLVLTARSDPLLPLARLRARGQVNEIRSADLRFTPAEALEFVQGAARLSLTPAQVTALDQSTEGWIAGLQMAALALQPYAAGPAGPAAVDEFLASFSGTHQFVFDYLAQEVLGRQDPQVTEFLYCTSILDRFCPALCAAVVDVSASDARAILDYLTRSNFFIIPQDDRHQWYRYHRLFADFLRAGLQAERLPEKYRRAAAWCERNGLEEDAVTYSLAARDWQTAARLVIRVTPRLLPTGQVTTLLNWFEALPVRTGGFDGTPVNVDLCAYYGWVSLMCNRLGIASALVEQGEKELRLARTPIPDASRGRLLGLKAYATYAGFASRDDRAEAVRLGEEALRLLGPEDAFFRLMELTMLGQIQRQFGSVPASLRMLEEAMRTAGGEQPGGRPDAGVVILQGNLGLAYYVHGERRRAQAYFEEALRQLNPPGGQVYLPTLFIYMALAPVYLSGGQLDAARASYERGVELCNKMGVNPIIIGGSDAYAVVQFVQGDSQGAIATVHASREEALRMQLPWIAGTLAAVEAWFRLRLGDLAAAEAWAAGAGLPPVTTADPDRPFDQLLHAYLMIARQDYAGAHTLLTALRVEAEESERIQGLVEILVLLGLASNGMGRPDEALAHAERAARLAEPEGSLGSFLNWPCEGLLRRLRADLERRGEERLKAFVEQALALAATASRAGGTGLVAPVPPPSAGLVEPITRRELDVLRLMAEGLSNAEIARRLYLTLNTLKSHTNTIYGKLDVHSRLQAVSRARQLGLLDAPEN